MRESSCQDLFFKKSKISLDIAGTRDYCMSRKEAAMTLFGHLDPWLLLGITWLALMLVTVAAMGLVARGGE